MRLDTALVRRGLARSRGHAQELLAAGDVRVDGMTVSRASVQIGPERALAVTAVGPQWVGRAAHKLVGAFAAFGAEGLTAHGKRCVDVGASTGGFTQVLLHQGAAEVIALDVGHGQLAEKVASDPRVRERSGTTVRGLTPRDLGGPVDLLVADLSFISLVVVLADLRGLLGADAEAVLLVKPQFEVGRTRLGKGGIVRSPSDRAGALLGVVEAAVELGLHVRGLAASPIEGSTGNAEYLLWLGTRPEGALGWEAVAVRARQMTEQPGEGR